MRLIRVQRLASMALIAHIFAILVDLRLDFFIIILVLLGTTLPEEAAEH